MILQKFFLMHHSILHKCKLSKTFGVSKSIVLNIVLAYVRGGIPAIIKIKEIYVLFDGVELIHVVCRYVLEGHTRWILNLLENRNVCI